MQKPESLSRIPRETSVLRHKLFTAIFCIFCLSRVGCDQREIQSDENHAKEELLAVHETGKLAHVTTDVDQLLANAGETFVSVSNGKISKQTRIDTKNFFTNYFDNATYQKYDDLEDPIVRVSKDGTLGWIISRLHVRRTQMGVDGVATEREFVYAGIMLFEKKDDRWIRVGNVSTFE